MFSSIVFNLFNKYFPFFQFGYFIRKFQCLIQIQYWSDHGVCLLLSSTRSPVLVWLTLLKQTAHMRTKVNVA